MDVMVSAVMLSLVTRTGMSTINLGQNSPKERKDIEMSNVEKFDQQQVPSSNVVTISPSAAEGVIQQVVIGWLTANISEYDSRRNRYKTDKRWIKEPELIAELDTVCKTHQPRADLRYASIQAALALYKSAQNTDQGRDSQDGAFDIPEWVMVQVEALHATFTESGDIRFTDGSSGGLKELISLVYAEAFTQKGLKQIKPTITKDQIITVLNNERDRLRYEYTKKAVEQIKFDPLYKTHAGTERAVEILTGASGPDAALDVAVLRHFCWQVKRKMLGLPVKRHLFVVLTGGQNAGKTTFLKLFFKPLGNLVVDLSIQAVCDERNYPEFQNHFIGFCDEMSKADKAEANELKKVITTEYLACHLMHTNSMGRPKQNLTFIGAANPALRDIIKDDTGMRRFHEIRVVGKEQLMPFWAEISDMDYVAIWKSVDENGQNPIEPMLAELAIRQEELRAKGLVEKFIEDSEIRPCKDSDGGLFVPTEEIYSQFADWCKGQGIRNFPEKLEFGRRMKGFNFTGDQLKVNGKRQRGFWFRKDADEQVVGVEETDATL